MNDERKRILDLVEKGTISATEALDLLEKIEAEKRGETSHAQPFQQAVDTENTSETSTEDEASSHKRQDDEQTKQEKSEHTDKEFIEDLKRDFNQFSTKFMDYVSTAFSKVKDMDFTGEKRQITETIQLGNEAIHNVSAKIPNGSLEIIPSPTGTAYLEVEVTPTVIVRGDEINDEFHKNFQGENDNGTVRITSFSRTMRVNVTLYLPQKEYTKIKAELFNGNFVFDRFTADEIDVESVNGKIKIADTTARKIKTETANGRIDVYDTASREIEAETLNGTVSLKGAFTSMEAKAASGSLTLSTTDPNAERVKARVAAGSIEIAIPKTVSLKGKVVTNFGKPDIQLQDVQYGKAQDQLFNKGVEFEKKVNEQTPLVIDAESRTGSVSVQYVL